MPRYLIEIEYDGTPYCGWQRQDQGLSVQQVIEEAVYSFTGENVLVYGSGRTDKGVHATGQTAHLDLTRNWQIEQVMMAINSYLRDKSVVILNARRVGAELHARFDARQRHYCYRILRRKAPPALLKNRVWHFPWTLDLAAMQAAAELLVGHHDFTSFRAAHCQSKSPMKTLDRAWVEECGDEIQLYFQSRSFLHNQVRAMTGTLLQIGKRKREISAIQTILEARDRTAAGPNAPACGLYLTRVCYPAECLEFHES